MAAQLTGAEIIASQVEAWETEADESRRIGEWLRAKGKTAKAPTKEEAEAKHVQNAAWHDLEELVINTAHLADNSNPEGINQYTDGGGSGDSDDDHSPTKQIADAVKLVSTFGRDNDDVSKDRERASKLVGLVSKMPKDELYRTLTDAGVEGLKPTDGKPRMLQRLESRITASVRARERAEV